MSKKKRRAGAHSAVPRPRPQAFRPPPEWFLEELAEAHSLMRRKRWAQARENLEALDRRSPDQPDVLASLLEVYHQLHDLRSHEEVCERLLKLRPEDADLTLVLAANYMANARPARAVLAFHRFLDRWPDHEQAAYARKKVAGVEAGLVEMLAEMGFSGEEGLELAALHEEAKGLLERGKYVQARKLEEQLLRRRPDFVPAFNNISLTYYMEGLLDQAIATAQRVLALEPENYHAVANITRYLCLKGRLDEGKEWAERLKAVTSEAGDVWVKKEEALSCLGDDRGVLDAFHAAKGVGRMMPSPESALLYHLAAVAAMRLGQEKEARRYWDQALRLQPALELVQQNLSDLRKPVGERHAPWPFSLPYWISAEHARELAEQVVPAAERGGEEAVDRALRRHLRRHPELAGLVPLLLELGDPMGREIALRLAVAARTPELLEALREFALGRRGPDPMRLQAGSVVAEAGLLPPGPARVWLDGDWREVVLVGFELHGEPMGRMSPRAQELLGEGISALHGGNAKEAERLFKLALEVEPDAPSVLNNLAAVYSAQRRIREAEAILRQIHERHPDYFFGRTGLAQICLSRGETEEAEALLQPLLSRRRLHFSEFAALCSAQIELFLARGDRHSARTWYEIWASADPDHPMLARFSHLGRGKRASARG